MKNRQLALTRRLQSSLEGSGAALVVVLFDGAGANLATVDVPGNTAAVIWVGLGCLSLELDQGVGVLVL